MEKIDLFVNNEWIETFEQLKECFQNADSSVKSSLLDYARNGNLAEWLQAGKEQEKQMSNEVAALDYDRDDSTLWNDLSKIIIGKECTVESPSFSKCFELKNISSNDCVVEGDVSSGFTVFVPKCKKTNVCLAFKVLTPQYASVKLSLQSPESRKTELGVISLKKSGLVEFSTEVLFDVQDNNNHLEAGSEWFLLSDGEKMNPHLFVTICSEEVVKLLKSAKLGDDDAQYKLGDCYYSGQGIAQSNESAVEWYCKSAEQGNVSAQYKLAQCYENGKGVEQSNESAVEWYRKSAELGCADAQFKLGVCYLYGRGVSSSFAEAVSWYRKAAEQKHTEAQRELGHCLNGINVPKSSKEAVDWYRKAAEQGCKYAQFDLAFCYFLGDGIKESFKDAVDWCLKSAEQDCSDAQNTMGFFYKSGKGVEQSDAKAIEWFSKAALQGNKYAQYNLAFCYEFGYGVDKSAIEAVRWYQKSAEQNLYDAQNALGICYEFGIGVARSSDKAKSMYRKATEQRTGSPNPARMNLQKMLKGEDNNRSRLKVVMAYRRTPFLSQTVQWFLTANHPFQMAYCDYTDRQLNTGKCR